MDSRVWFYRFDDFRVRKRDFRFRPGAARRPAAKQPLGSALRAEVGGHAVHRLGQRRQVLFNHQPDGPEVNTQVAMHYHVAKPGEFAPRNLRLGALDLTRQALA